MTNARGRGGRVGRPPQPAPLRHCILTGPTRSSTKVRAAVEEALADGWLHSGDLRETDARGFVSRSSGSGSWTTS
jgi:hypothetical protein